MKAALSVLIALLATPAAATEALPAWLAGTWRMESGQTLVEERWSPPHAGLMLGTSRTYIGGKPAFFEFIRIEAREDGVYYVAQPRGGAATDFRRVADSADEQLFENPDHDFPQRVRYRLAGDGSLHASIEGSVGGRERVERWHYQPVDGD